MCWAQSAAFTFILLTILVWCRTTSAPSSRSESSESDIFMKHKNTAYEFRLPLDQITLLQFCFLISTSSEPHLLPAQCCQVIYHGVIYHVAIYFTPWITIFTERSHLKSDWAGSAVRPGNPASKPVLPSPRFSRRIWLL